MQPQRLVLVANQQHVRVCVLLQLVDERPADGVEIREDDMAAGFLRQRARCAGRVLRLHPRLVGEPDERKRQDDEHRHHPEQHHANGEEFAWPIVKRDLAVAQRGHGHHRPIKTVEPIVLLSLARHQRVKHRSRQRHEHQHNHHQLDQLAEVASAGRLAVGQRKDGCGENFHRVNFTPSAFDNEAATRDRHSGASRKIGIMRGFSLGRRAHWQQSRRMNNPATAHPESNCNVSN